VKKDTRSSDYQAALRVVKAIEGRRQPLWVDVFALRLWAGSSARLRPLEEIAKAIVQAEKINQDGIVGMPDVTQINGPKNIMFWANTTAADLWMRQCYSTGPNLNFKLPNQRTDVLAFVERAKRKGISIAKSENQ
jgi:hypothetical protein